MGRANSSSPDSMSSSYHGNSSSSMNNEANTLIQMTSSLIENVNADQGNIMVQSFDPTILSSSQLKLTSESNVRSVVPQMNGSLICIYGTRLLCFRFSNEKKMHLITDYQTRQCPLVATSKIVPVPETLMSPDCPPPNVAHQSVVHSTPSQPKTETFMPNQKVSAIKSTKGLESQFFEKKKKQSFSLIP